MQRFLPFASKAGFLLGVLLLSANIAGSFTSLRNDDIFVEKDVLFRDDITLTPEEVFAAIDTPATDRKAYARRLTDTVNKGIAHYWFEEGLDKYNIRIPFYENYVLYALGFLIPEHYRTYQFRDYHKAIERGVGLCSQHSIIVAEILKEKGIPSRIIGLLGHVVAAAQVDAARNEWWILDADYGVVIPHSPDAVQDSPQLVAPYYRERGYDEHTVATLTEIYGKEGNVFFAPSGAEHYGWKIYWGEKAAYILIWLIPGVLMLPMVVSAGAGTDRRAGRDRYTVRGSHTSLSG